MSQYIESITPQYQSEQCQTSICAKVFMYTVFASLCHTQVISGTYMHAQVFESMHCIHVRKCLWVHTSMQKCYCLWVCTRLIASVYGYRGRGYWHKRVKVFMVMQAGLEFQGGHRGHCLPFFSFGLGAPELCQLQGILHHLLALVPFFVFAQWPWKWVPQKIKIWGLYASVCKYAILFLRTHMHTPNNLRTCIRKVFAIISHACVLTHKYFRTHVCIRKQLCTAHILIPTITFTSACVHTGLTLVHMYVPAKTCICACVLTNTCVPVPINMHACASAYQ